MAPRFTPVADRALLVGFADEIDDGAHADLSALDRALAAAPPPGLIETVPALVNILIVFDPLLTDHRAVEAAVRALLPNLTHEETTGALREVEVCYEPPFAPDLEAVAAAAGLSREATVATHLAGDYRVLMYGFSPGYAYLGGVPQAIQTPRKPVALRGIAAGSVIIAGPQCLVTTLTMPTGWSIIGRSPTPVLTDDAERPFLFDIGDRVAFRRIDRAGFDRAARAAGDG